MTFLASMFSKGPRCTSDPWSKAPHVPTCGIRPAAAESERRNLPGEFNLPHPAIAGINFLGTIRSRKQRFGRTQTSDTVRSHEAPRALGRTDESKCMKPSASGVDNKYSCHLHQESKWTNPGMLYRLWYRNTFDSWYINVLIPFFMNPSLQIDSPSLIKYSIKVTIL